RGLPALLARDGTALRLPALAIRLAVAARRRLPLRARRSRLPLPWAARVQGEVQPRVGAALSRLPGRPRAAADPRRRLGADRRRLPPHPDEVSRRSGDRRYAAP